MSGEDACRRLELGASLVQLYTGLIYRGRVSLKMQFDKRDVNYGPQRTLVRVRRIGLMKRFEVTMNSRYAG